MKAYSRTQALTECAVMIALGTVLSFVKFEGLWGQGGSITLCSMLPVIAAAYRHGPRAGFLSGAVFGVLQLMLGADALKGNSLSVFVAAVFLDYILAYGVLGAAGLFRNGRNSALAFAGVAAFAVLLRFVCHFISGVLVWSSYAPQAHGLPLYIYSLTYNGSYMLPELIITTVAAFALYPVLTRRRAEA